MKNNAAIGSFRLGEEWRKELVAWMKQDLSRRGVVASGELISSVVSTIQKTSEGWIVQVSTRDYGGILNSLSYRKKFKAVGKLNTKPLAYRTISRARVKGEKALFAKLMEYYNAELNDSIFLHLNIDLSS